MIKKYTLQLTDDQVSATFAALLMTRDAIASEFEQRIEEEGGATFAEFFETLACIQEIESVLDMIAGLRK